MAWLTIVVLALGLSVDTFAAAVTKGATLKKLKAADVRRIATVFGACAVLAPMLGWGFGTAVSDYIVEIDHWVAFVLLAGVGLHMVWNGFHADGDVDKDISPARVLLTAVATNVDAVAVGIGLAFVKVNILAVCAAVGVVTVGAIYVGLEVGRRSGAWLGARAEVAGGAVLIGIGCKILVEHVFGW